MPGRRARARAAARVGAARAALEEVPPRGDPRVRGDAAVTEPYLRRWAATNDAAAVAAAVAASVEAATAP